MSTKRKDVRPKRGQVSPYSTGGGGVVLEHSFGATLLAALLSGNPVRALGDEQTLIQITFQASSWSPVDDIVIFGEPMNDLGAGRQLSIGVRRNPTIARSDEGFIDLLSKYVIMVRADWERIRTGTLRLGLAVSAPHAGAKELSDLTELARMQPDCDSFRNATTNKKVKLRLKYFDQAVLEATKKNQLKIRPKDFLELTWRLLNAIYVIEIQLEGDVAPDHTAAVHLSANLAFARKKHQIYGTYCLGRDIRLIRVATSHSRLTIVCHRTKAECC